MIYDSIKELPIYNYNQFTETRDFKYLFDKKVSTETIEKNKDKLIRIWEFIQEEIINEFGLSDDVIGLRRLYKTLYVARLKYLQTFKNGTSERFLLNKIKETENEIIKRNNNNEKNAISFYKQKSVLHSHYKMIINEKTISTIDYLYLIEQFKNEVKVKENT